MPFYTNEQILGRWDGEFNVSVTVEDIDLEDNEEEPSQCAYLHIENPFTKDSFGWITQEDAAELIKNLQAALKTQKKLNKELGWK